MIILVDLELSVYSDTVNGFFGWLAASLPATGGRYHSIQFTDPASGANFASLGTRTTGPGPGDVLLRAAGWTGATPAGMPRIGIPHRAALLIGRVFAAGDADREAAYALAAQVRLVPLRSYGSGRPLPYDIG